MITLILLKTVLQAENNAQQGHKQQFYIDINKCLDSGQTTKQTQIDKRDTARLGAKRGYDKLQDNSGGTRISNPI